MNISSLQANDINLDSSSGFGRNIERANTVQKKWTFCGSTNHSAEKCFKWIRQEKEKARAAGASDIRQTERTSRKCFRCGSEDHLIVKFTNPQKDNEKRWKQVCFNEKVNRACNNGKDNSNQKIYVSMACMSVDDEYTSGNFGDSSQLTNWILDSGAMCHMTQEVSDFIPCSLEDTGRHTEVADGHHVSAKQKVQVQIKMRDNHGYLFIATLHNVLLKPDLCNRLF